MAVSKVIQEGEGKDSERVCGGNRTAPESSHTASQPKKRAGGSKEGGAPRFYSLEAMAALKVDWEATDRLCSKCFRPFLPEL